MSSLNGPFRLVTQTREFNVDPEAGPDAAYLLLVGKKVVTAVASEDGGLAVEFTDGARLEVPSDKYEAWQLTGQDHSIVVSVAGGGLAVWGPGTWRDPPRK